MKATSDIAMPKHEYHRRVERFVRAGALLVGALLWLLSGAANAAWQTPGTPTEALATAQAVPPVGITATVTNAYFNITPDDVGRAVAEQLQLQAVENKAEVTLTAGTPAVLHSANHPLKVSIHALQVDTASRRW